MLISKLFFPVLREVSADAKLKSHQIMLKAGMIRQSAAGIYSWLPLGLKVLKKIEQVVREEQNNVGAQVACCNSHSIVALRGVLKFSSVQFIK